MLGQYLTPLALHFAAVRVGLACALWLGLGLLWRRPNAAKTLGLILGVHLLAWAFYVHPLGRVYALGEGTDRAFNMGMAACVANGASPFEHTQVRFGSPEPFWNLTIAGLAGLRDTRVGLVMMLLSPLALVAVALALYLPDEVSPRAEATRWERALVVFSALGLSSFSMTPDAPVPALWAGNFLLKPNHAMAWAVVAMLLVQRRHTRGWALRWGVWLALLAWVFLIDWAYVIPGLLIGEALRPREARRWRAFAIALLIGIASATPYVHHLLRDFHPFSEASSARHLWADAHGLVFALPHWSTLDLGPLFVFGLIGAVCAWQRGSAWDHRVLGLWLAGWLEWLASIPAALFGFAPEPDEMHYFIRLTTALLAGLALAAIARHLESWRTWPVGRGSLAVLIACVPLCFVSYWDPPTMDRYYSLSLEPVRPKILAYTEWIRTHTPREAVFLAGRSSSSWIPALAGRRVLLAEAGQMRPGDALERKRVERVLLTSGDAEQIRAAAAKYSVTHLAIDWPLVEEYGVTGFEGLARAPVYETLFINSMARVVGFRQLNGAPSNPSPEDTHQAPGPP